MRGPRILVFSTINISDPGIDLAGASHMEYPASVEVIPLPCSSGIRPSWIIHALKRGFDGVFIAADGGDCAYHPDCTTLTGKVVERAQEMMREEGIDPGRLKMAAICSVCAEAFVSHMKKFSRYLEKAGGRE
ncbi:MAG: hydrogenase iron-sulfur subunit [Deltaproteobacteria bacterium]|nr:MAG: hydrogenase iron-sulfur subunit [Deltaproteobacteria bacterium]